MTIQYWVISTNYKYIFYIIVSKVFNLVFCDVSRQLLQFDKMPTTATTVPLCSFLLFRIIKFTVWIFFVAQFRQNFFLKYFLGLWVCFCSQEISNFHNARGHYGEISPRQQLITGRNFTRCCSLWPELSKYGYTFDKFINSTCSR